MDRIFTAPESKKWRNLFDNEALRNIKTAVSGKRPFTSQELKRKIKKESKKLATKDMVHNSTWKSIKLVNGGPVCCCPITKS